MSLNEKTSRKATEMSGYWLLNARANFPSFRPFSLYFPFSLFPSHFLSYNFHFLSFSLFFSSFPPLHFSSFSFLFTPLIPLFLFPLSPFFSPFKKEAISRGLQTKPAQKHKPNPHLQRSYPTIGELQPQLPSPLCALAQTLPASLGP